MDQIPTPAMTKRDLLTLIGRTAGATAMYMAMAQFGQAAASTFKGPVKLEGDANMTETERKPKLAEIDAKLAELSKNEDLSRYIL